MTSAAECAACEQPPELYAKEQKEAEDVTREIVMRLDGAASPARIVRWNKIAAIPGTSTLLATLRASPNASLRAAYHTVLDALDEDKELTFALIQDHCAREIRSSTREPDRRGQSRGDDRRGPARGDDRSFVRPQTGTPLRRQDFSSDRPGDISAFLCNILEANNVKPKRVLRAHNLPTHDLQDGHALNALFQAALPYMPFSGMCCGHVEQVALPFSDAYLSSGHTVQGPPLGP